MDEIKTIIELLEKVRGANNKTFNSCSEEKLLTDTEYGNLYHAFWLSDFRLRNVVELLKSVDKNLMCEKAG